MKEEDYVELAHQRILQLLSQEHALVHPEMEARLAEIGFGLHEVERIDPHHLTTARKQLEAEKLIVSQSATTVGGLDVVTIQPAQQYKQKTEINKAARRKRKLYGQYSAMVRSSARYPGGRIGAAGERALRASLLAAGNILPIEPGAGEARKVLGTTLNGPLDSAGFYVPVSAQGLPSATITVLIEVKNIRSWIYPSAKELYQLLYKSMLVQRAAPQHPVLPLLVCRKAHPRTFWMAKDLGFMVLAMDRQYVERTEEEELLSLRSELAFRDLTLLEPDATSARIYDRLRTTLPKIAEESAQQWQATVADLGTEIEYIWGNRSKANQLLKAVDLLRLRADSLGYKSRSW